MTNIRSKPILTMLVLIGLFTNLFALCAPVCEAASFGASPPSVTNDHMLPGATFEQVIRLSRDTIEAPMKLISKLSGDEELMKWITIEDQESLLMEKGQNILPVKIIVDVPKRAALKNYRGYVYFSMQPLKSQSNLSGGEVAIALGGFIDVDITVIGTKVTDFRIRSISTESTTESNPLTLKVEVENLGNTELSELDGKITIYEYNSQRTEPIQTLDFIAFTDPVSPDEINMRRMVFTDYALPVGEYKLVVQVSKDGNIIYDNAIIHEVKAKVVPVVTPEAALAEKPALPGGSAEETAPEETTAKESATVPSIIVQMPASDLKSSAPAEANSAYLILGLAGLGVGLIAIIGIIVVLVMVLKNQQRAAISQFPMQGQFPMQIPPQPPVIDKTKEVNLDEKK